MQSNADQGVANASMLLSQKFRTKTQLFSYLTQRLQVFLPEKDNCRMKFLQQIFGGEKDVVLNHQVPHFTIPSQPEIAVKVVFENLMQDDALMRYFDTERYLNCGKLPPKHFFWGIMFTVRKDLSTALVQEAIDRRLQDSVTQHPQATIQFAEVWAQKLLEYPAIQTSGQNGRQTNLFAMMQKAKKPQARRVVEIPNTLKEYNIQQSRERKVTNRKVQPNVIRNKEEDEEWAQNME